MLIEPPYKTLVDLYDRSISAYASRPLFGTKKGGAWSFITYAEFGSLADRFRAGLLSLGVARGDRVAIISNNRVEWAVASHACSGLGAVFVPMYEAQNPADWEYIVRDCEAKVILIANDKVLAKARGLFDAAPSLRAMVLLDGATNGDARILGYASLLRSGPAPVTPPDPSDVAVILYTSGTTGNPKGVVLTHGNLASNVNGAHTIFPIRCDDRSLSILPWAHAFGQTAELHTLFSFGASMAICEGVDKILENLAEVKPSILCCVPTIFNRLYAAVHKQLAARPRIIRQLTELALAVKAKERAGKTVHLHERAAVRLVDKLVFQKVRARLGGRLQFAISGGAALSREVGEFIDSIGIVVFEGYGLTETSPVISANGPGGRRIGSVGRPFPGVRVVIAPPPEGRGEGEGGRRGEGEIVVYGPNVMKEYFRHPDETAAVFTPDGGFRTGDMGYLDEDQFLFITGRIKEQYKLENGKYVVPSPLEERLKLSPYIANVMVYGDNKPHNVALIVPNLPALKAWADGAHFELPSGVEALSKDARVRELFTNELKAQSSDFKGFERVVDFALVPDFTVDNGQLTPKMSIKRRRVIDAHSAVLAQLYANRDASKGRRSPTAAA